MSAETTEGTPEGALPFGEGSVGPVGDSPPGVRQVSSDAARTGLAEGAVDHLPGEPAPDADRPSGGGGVADDPRDQNQAGPAVPPQRPSRQIVNKHDVALALREAGGNQVIAARSLGISQKSVSEWIRRDDQLRALYGRRGNQAEITPAVTQAQAMRRDPTDNPVPADAGVELAELVTEQDNEILLKGLKKLGMSDELRKRIRDLDGLAESSGKLISVSLQKTHAMYLIQLFNLMDLAENLRARLMAKPGEEGFEALSNLDRAFLTRNYTEMVKESGNGYEKMLKGAQVMTEMLMGADPQNANAPVIKRKPGWGRNGSNK